MKDSTTGYCSCCAGLFDCTTGSEESKKLRRAREILAGQLICLFVQPTWSFKHHTDYIQDFSCSSIFYGSYSRLSNTCFFLLGLFNSYKQCIQCYITCHVIIQNIVEYLRIAQMSQGILTALPTATEYPSKVRAI